MRFCVEHSIMKKVVSVIIILCFLLNPTTSFGYSKPTLFKTKSHAQRYLQDEKPKAKDILKDPSILDVNKRYGKIMEWHKAKGDDKLIIHIQDRHVDETAQLNIASIIEELTQKYNVYLLSLEGASTELDTSFYDKFPDGDIKEKVSKFFVKKGIFTGSEFYKITHRNQYLRAIGAEDKELYLQHFDSYKENQIDKESLLSFIKAIRQVLNNLKDKAYSKHLKKLDLKSSKYRNKQIQLVDFAKTIADYAKKTKIELSNYPNVSSFLDLVEKEENVFPMIPAGASYSGMMIDETAKKGK